jgi:hypothetical protein
MMMFFQAGTKIAKGARALLAAITAALLLGVLSGPAAGMGLGVTPPQLEITDALRGNTYEENIIVFNTDNVTHSYGLTTTDNLASWVSYYLPDDPDTAITSIEVAGRDENGVGSKTVLVKIAIPADTPNDTYEGQLLITAVAGEASESGVGVGMQVPVLVSIDVTGTQIISGKVTDILAEDVEVGYPLRVIVMFQNTGNVAEAPTIETTITYKGEDVANFISDSTKVAPGKAGNIEVEWDTTGNAPAEYAAKVVVSLNGEVLKQKAIVFNILPLGQLTRSGEITDVTIEGSTVVGITCKVQATFKNTGQIDTNVYFTGEAYLGDTFIQVITSDTLLVKRGQEGVLTAYYNPEQGGDITLKIQANYEGKLSEIKEIAVEVIILHDITLSPKPSEEAQTQASSTALATQSQSSAPLYGAVGAIVVIIAGIFGVGTLRKRKQSGKKSFSIDIHWKNAWDKFRHVFKK